MLDTGGVNTGVPGMGKIDPSLKLNNRERMVRTVLGQDVDRLPLHLWGPWGETIQRWRTEGYPEENTDFQAYFGLDTAFSDLAVNLGYYPAFESKVLEDRGGTRIIQDRSGSILEIMAGHSTIPKIVRPAVSDRASWEKLKERLNSRSPERYPDWQKEMARFEASGAAIQIGKYPYGLFGTLRDMMGVEELLVNFYDEPELIHAMMDYLTDFWISIYEEASRHIKIDHIHIWEDMSGKQGPLISPAMFREFMTPNYKKIIAFSKDHGIPIVSVDTDGNMDIMMTLLNEADINLVMPFEVQAGCDVVAIKKQYPHICPFGGIDKRALAISREAIDAEFARVDPLLHQSGYMPGLDHLVHPEISLDNFKYFVERLKEKVRG
jgi:uroporphyrinogen decarboxylase